MTRNSNLLMRARQRGRQWGCAWSKGLHPWLRRRSVCDLAARNLLDIGHHRLPFGAHAAVELRVDVVTLTGRDIHRHVSVRTGESLARRRLHHHGPLPRLDLDEPRRVIASVDRLDDGRGSIHRYPRITGARHFAPCWAP